MRRAAASNALIAVGLLLALLIAYGQHRNDMKTDRLIEQVESLPFEELNQGAAPEAETNRDAVIATSRSAKNGKQARDAAIAVIEIPAIKLKAPVVEGTGKQELQAAVGHLTQSGTLGRTGDNVALAGHRSWVYGQFFNRLDELDKDDKILVTSADGQRFVYVVTDKKVVKPTDVEVANPVPGRTLLTLITCHPFHSNKYRLIITAERVDADPMRTT